MYHNSPQRVKNLDHEAAGMFNLVISIIFHIINLCKVLDVDLHNNKAYLFKTNFWEIELTNLIKVPQKSEEKKIVCLVTFSMIEETKQYYSL